MSLKMLQKPPSVKGLLAKLDRDRALELLHAIDSEARGQVRSEWDRLHWDQSDRYVIRSLMEEAITSSQLEGAATTHQVALDMLRTGRRPETRDERMIGNNFQAMKHNHGYWLMEYVSISRLLKKAPGRYGRSFLLTESDDNDLTYFIIDQLDVISRAIEDLHRELARKAEESAKFQSAIAATRGLNHRQRALLIRAAKHPHQVYTIASHRQSHGVTYATARSDLLQLAEQNWLVQHTRGRRMEFRAGPRVRRARNAL